MVSLCMFVDMPFDFSHDRLNWGQRESKQNLESEKSSRMKTARHSGDGMDILSTLPDYLICHILSFLDTKYAVQTSVLSKRFRNLWSSVPALKFDNNSFKRISSYKKFVDRVLALRDNSIIKVNELKLSRTGDFNSYFLDKVMKYAMSHDVQAFTLDIQYNEFYCLPESGFSSESLRTFNLKTCRYFGQVRTPLYFPKLKRLYLQSVSFAHSDILSGCPCLRELALVDCPSRGLDTLTINAPRLTNLTISSSWSELVECKVVVLTPRLAAFYYTGSHPLQSSIGELPGLEVVSIDVDHYTEWEQTREEERKFALDLINLLRLFHNANSVTLSLGTIEALSLFPDLLAQHSSFGNMKFLKFKASRKRSTFDIPAYLMAYLLKDSPDAKLPWNCLGS